MAELELWSANPASLSYYRLSGYEEEQFVDRVYSERLRLPDLPTDLDDIAAYRTRDLKDATDVAILRALRRHPVVVAYDAGRRRQSAN